VRKLLLPESVPQLNLGPFQVDVSDVKSRMMANIDARYKIIEECIRDRVGALSNSIKEDVEEHIRVITNEDFDHPERGSIEELAKVKKYIDQIQRKKELIDEMQLKITKLYACLGQYNMGES
jgi:hypothetical protein